MKFSPAFLEDIRNRLPISMIVAERLGRPKRKSGGELWYQCPFHSEKSESFKCNDQRGRFHCFGCGADGDIFKFLMLSRGRTFPEAVEELAGKAGLSVPKDSPEAIRREARRLSLIEVVGEAQAFFRAQLRAPAGRAALEYARGRMTDAQMERFGVGYAPADRSGLKSHLAAKGVDQAAMIDAGLLIAGDDIPVSYDRFRDRLMFPIFDEKGRPVAFGGRAMAKDVAAKYLNSPEGPTFHKGGMLYNGASAKAAAWDGAPVVVVEGYVDVIATVSAGFEGAVAPMGTALTEDQLRLLWRMSAEPIVCFDGDPAGIKAAYRLVDLALPMMVPGRSLRFVILPPGMDPDDMVRNSGAKALADALGQSVPLINVLWRRATEGRQFESPDALAALERGLLDQVAAIPDENLRTHYIRAVRDQVFAIPRPMRVTRSNGSSNHSAAPGVHRLLHGVDRGGISLREATIIAAMVGSPEDAGAFGFDILERERMSEPARRALSDILGILGELPESSIAELMVALHRHGGGRTIDQAIDMCRGAGLVDLGPEGNPEAARAVLKSITH